MERPEPRRWLGCGEAPEEEPPGPEGGEPEPEVGSPDRNIIDVTGAYLHSPLPQQALHGTTAHETASSSSLPAVIERPVFGLSQSPVSWRSHFDELYDNAEYDEVRRRGAAGVARNEAQEAAAAAGWHVDSGSSVHLPAAQASSGPRPCGWCQAGRFEPCWSDCPNIRTRGRLNAQIIRIEARQRAINAEQQRQPLFTLRPSNTIRPRARRNWRRTIQKLHRIAQLLTLHDAVRQRVLPFAVASTNSVRSIGVQTGSELWEDFTEEPPQQGPSFGRRLLGKALRVVHYLLCERTEVRTFLLRAALRCARRSAAPVAVSGVVGYAAQYYLAAPEQ